LSKSFSEIARHPARFGAILALGVAIAMLALFLARLDTQALHTDGLVEMDGNVAYDGGLGVDPGSSPCPPGTSNPVDCIPAGSPAGFDWADDPATGDQQKGLCKAGTSGLIDEASPLPAALPAGSDVKCSFDIVLGATDDITYHTGSDKDFQEITSSPPGAVDTWHCRTSANATSKADLLNAGFLLTTSPVDGHQLFYAMAERDSEHGDVFNGFWIVQAAVTSPTDCTGGPFNFTGQHVCGDVLVLFNYDSGGRVGTSAALQWQRAIPAGGTTPVDLLGCNGVDDGAAGFGFPDPVGDDCEIAEGPGLASHAPLCLIVTSSFSDCRANPGADDFCGRVNSETTCHPVPKAGCNGLDLGPGCFATPWEPNDGSCPAGGAAPPTYSEAGIDLTQFGISVPCVGAFIAESRSSSTTDATLKDFALAPTGVTCSSSLATDIHAGSRTATEPPPHTVLTDCTNTPPSCGTTGTVVAGATVHDAAFLAIAGPSGTAGGTLTFTRFTSNDCTTGGTAQAAIAVSQTIGTTQRYESADFTTPTVAPLITALSYKVSYSGDAAKQIPASTSICEPLKVINPALALDKDAAPVASVTYTYQLKNSGDVDLTSPSVTDDKCSPAQVLDSGTPPRNTGDTNTNGEFDPLETWNFACTTPIALSSGVALVNTATGTATDPLNNTLTKMDVVTTTATLVVSDPNGE
jgi:hypothetical protein